MIGYLDMPCGISGDMMLGCLVDAGWPIEQLQALPGRLKIEHECQIDARNVMKGPLRALLVNVRVQEGKAHRHLHHVHAIIDQADMEDAVKTRAKAVFTRLAEAEARVHGTTAAKIHFHEVGAVDAIIDIVGATLGLHQLGVSKLYASALPMGSGWANTQHGKIPLPAPATLELLSACGAPTVAAPAEGEWVTPTGAALVAEIAEFAQPSMRLRRVAVGAGQRNTSIPNVARLWLGDPAEQSTLVELQTNIDDMNPQLYESVCRKLLDAGARDVWLTPIQMKKGRPAIMLSVLAEARLETSLSDILLRHTTTLGVRVRGVMNRHEARREVRPLQTPLGEVRVKLKWVGQELIGATPEYDDVRALSEARGVSEKDVYDAALTVAYETFRAPAR